MTPTPPQAEVIGATHQDESMAKLSCTSFAHGPDGLRTRGHHPISIATDQQHLGAEAADTGGLEQQPQGRTYRNGCLDAVIDQSGRLDS